MNFKKDGFRESILGILIKRQENLPYLVLIWGGLLGVLMILKSFLRLQGLYIFVLYAILAIGFFQLVKKSEISYLYRFLGGVGSFMLATIILYLYIALFMNPNLLTVLIWAHLWRIGAMLGISIIVNGVLTYLQHKFKGKLA